ncbi:MAG TPA: GNAT family N-acetyltransferase, partial [Candidatus Paceibacterota bacterium]
AAKYEYEPKHFDSHVIAITNETLGAVRERYRRYHKKYSSLFTLNVVEEAAVTPELEETYFQLHVKDAGRQVRSRESFTKQADTAREGEGFYVVTTHIKSGTTAGMLLVSLYKNIAYDNSVAVDPDFADRYVGHLLKWRAIEELQKRRVLTYELGPKYDNTSATKKELGINHFKEGWSRGCTRTVWEMEKYLDTK